MAVWSDSVSSSRRSLVMNCSALSTVSVLKRHHINCKAGHYVTLLDGHLADSSTGTPALADYRQIIRNLEPP